MDDRRVDQSRTRLLHLATLAFGVRTTYTRSLRDGEDGPAIVAARKPHVRFQARARR